MAQEYTSRAKLKLKEQGRYTTEAQPERCGGKNANTVGVPIGATIADALSKAPELNAIDQNEMRFTETDDKLEMEIVNNSTSVSPSALAAAERDASIRTEKRMRYMIDAITKRDKNI